MKRCYRNIAPHAEPTTVMGQSNLVKKTLAFLGASVAVASIGVGAAYSQPYNLCTQGMIFGSDAGYTSVILACASDVDTSVTATVKASTPGSTGKPATLAPIPANKCVSYSVNDITNATGVPLVNSGQRALLQIQLGNGSAVYSQNTQVVFLLVGPGGSIAPMPTTECYVT